MKFIKVTTKKTPDELNSLSFSSIQIDMMKRVFDGIQYVEFLNEKGLHSIFCYLSDYNLKRLSDLLIDLSIDFFSIEDLTNKVLLCESIHTSYLDDDGSNIKEDIDKLINDFYIDNITVDFILDKINIKGVESINEIDKGILENN
jgi:hypothetical protein